MLLKVSGYFLKLHISECVALDAVGQKLRFRQAVVSLGKLLPQHLAVLGSHIIKAILLVRDADGLLEVCRIGGGIHERQFKVDSEPPALTEL